MHRIVLGISVIALGLISLINAYEFLKGTSKDKHQIIVKSKMAAYVYLILISGMVSIISSVIAYIIQPDLLFKTSVIIIIGLILILNALMGMGARVIVTNEGVGYMTVLGRIIRFVQWKNVRDWKRYKKNTIDFKVKIGKSITHITLKASTNKCEEIEKILEMNI